MLSIIRSLIAREAARLIAGASAAAVAGALWLAGQAGVELSAEVVAGVAAIAGLIATELIRRFVYSEATVAAVTDAAYRAGAIGSETRP